jgi:outer membrane protein
MKSTTILIAALIAGSAPLVSAQTAPDTLRLTADDAVKMALEHNIDLTVDRLDPRISDTRVAAAAGAFRPTITSNVQRNSQLQPPANFLFPVATRSHIVSANAGLAQRLPWFGTSYNVSWTATNTNSNSFLNSYNPLVQSGLAINVSQPLIRDLTIDPARQQLAISRTNRDIADTRLRERLVHTTANVKTAYWNLVAALANVEARRSALALAEELVRVNKAKVDVGSSPPLDLVSAQAEVAATQEQLIIAETTVKQTEDRLRMLILDTTRRENWNVKIEPIDAPPYAMPAVDVDAAVARAMSARADLVRALKEIDNARIGVKYAGNQKQPDVRLNASYQANGLGGTQVLRSGGFPGTIVGAGVVTNFAGVLNQLLAGDFPTWTFGVGIAYPIGQSAEQANDARARLEQSQAVERLKSAQARAIQQIRDAAWKIEMNAKRIETTRAARELAEQRLDAERKRLDVGMSTSFLVIQAQRDLAQANTNELAAVLAYDLALVDFEALQEAPPASGDTSSSGRGNASEPLPVTLTPPEAPTGAAPIPRSAAIPGVPEQRN